MNLGKKRIIFSVSQQNSVAINVLPLTTGDFTTIQQSIQKNERRVKWTHIQYNKDRQTHTFTYSLHRRPHARLERKFHIQDLFGSTSLDGMEHILFEHMDTMRWNLQYSKYKHFENVNSPIYQINIGNLNVYSPSLMFVELTRSGVIAQLPPIFVIQTDGAVSTINTLMIFYA